MGEQQESDDLQGLGDELRRRMSGEFRRSAEEDEHAAAKVQQRALTLEHVAYELLSRGDTIAVSLGDERVRGVVVHAKGDLMSVETPHGQRIDVHLSGRLAIQVVERSPQPGRSRDPLGAESFIARLREIELEQQPVVVIAPEARGRVGGTINAVAKDVLILTDPDAGRWYLPLASIVAVMMR